MIIDKKRYTRICFAAIVFLCVPSCHILYKIEISENGVAAVDITCHELTKDEILEYDSTAGAAADFFYSPEPKRNDENAIVLDSIIYRHQRSSVIQNFKATSSNKVHYKSSFVVLNLDSLGEYLCPIYEFSHPIHYLTRDSFSIVCPPAQDSLSTLQYGSCIFVEMNYLLPYEISEVYTSSSWIEVSFKKRTLYIKTRLDHHNFAPENSVVTAKFK